MNKNYQVCTRGVWDTTVPGITFDQHGASNYSKLQDQLVAKYPRGEKGKIEWENIVQDMKRNGKNNKYDCIVGISGGTDSSYLLHHAVEYGLRPLAVTVDNGWNTEISVMNIEKIVSKLNVDLECYEVDNNEMNDLLVSFMKASMPWVDFPSDMAISSKRYEIANSKGIEYILTGGDFRSEGKQPTEWTYSDARQLKYIHKTFGKRRLNTFPCLSIKHHMFLRYAKGIKVIRPFYYLDYQKKEAQKFLSKEYKWTYYGGHHHENLFTKFVICYWLPKKFNIDKRIITLSAQVHSGEITRQEALDQLHDPPYDQRQMEEDKDFVLQKLELSHNEFKKIWKRPNKTFLDYPSSYPTIRGSMKLMKPFFEHLFGDKPNFLLEAEFRDS